MNQILDQRSNTLTEKIAVILAGFGLCYIWCNLIVLFFKTIGLEGEYLIESFIMSVIVAPLWEELLFRRGVVYLTLKLDVFYRLPIIIVSSVVFGWLHGSVINVFFQGVIGFIIAVVYVKNNYCYWSAVSLHALWNLMLFITQELL